MAYIEPCCAQNQLPQLLRQSKGGFCFFQTSGDVTLQKLLDSASSLASDHGHTLLLSVAEVDIPMLRSLAYYFRRGWTKRLMLLTQKAQTELVTSELKDYLANVTYAADPLIIDGQLAVIPIADETATAEAKTLIIQGAMLSQPEFSLSLYAAYLGSDEDIISQAIAPAISKINTKPILKVINK